MIPRIQYPEVKRIVNNKDMPLWRKVDKIYDFDKDMKARETRGWDVPPPISKDYIRDQLLVWKREGSLRV